VGIRFPTTLRAEITAAAKELLQNDRFDPRRGPLPILAKRKEAKPNVAIDVSKIAVISAKKVAEAEAKKAADKKKRETSRREGNGYSHFGETGFQDCGSGLCGEKAGC